MSERIRPRLIADEAYQQYETALNVNARRVLYDKYAVNRIGLVDPTDPASESWGIELESIRALRSAGYNPHEAFADIGCGDGRFIERMVACGHEGPMIGINYPGDLYLPAQIALEGRPNVGFIESVAQDLRLPDGRPIKDGSIGTVSQRSLLYHLPDYSRALEEADRILKPGGLFLIETKDVGNQGRLWNFARKEIVTELEGLTAVGKTHDNYLGLLPPESFYSHFNFKTEHAALSPMGYRRVSGIGKFRHFGNLAIPATEEGWEDYKWALFSLKDLYKIEVDGKTPFLYIYPSDMWEAIEKGVKPIFFAEAEKNGGFFIDRVKMGFDIWQKADEKDLSRAA